MLFISDVQYYVPMACEISPICDFLFGSIRTNLLMDTVDVELIVWMVKGIYTYRKDHTVEPMIFTHGEKRWHLSLPWDAKFRHMRMIRGVRKCYNGVILSSSQPLQWHRLTKEKGLLAKSEPGGQTRPDAFPWRLKTQHPRNISDKHGYNRYRQIKGATFS